MFCRLCVILNSRVKSGFTAGSIGRVILRRLYSVSARIALFLLYQGSSLRRLNSQSLGEARHSWHSDTPRPLYGQNTPINLMGFSDFITCASCNFYSYFKKNLYLGCKVFILASSRMHCGACNNRNGPERASIKRNGHQN